MSPRRRMSSAVLAPALFLALSASTTLGLFSTARAVDLAVVSMNPPRNTAATIYTNVSVTFDRAVQPATITSSSFRVFGRASGNVAGSFAFSNAGRTVTFARSQPFSAGEMVYVNLAHSILAADGGPLRAAGFAFSFTTRTGPSTLNFLEIDQMTNRTDGNQTRIYGAAASDLNEDGYLDLTTVNEVSADVRVFLNRGDGTGLYHPFLTPQAIGVEASPNETGDFNNDGHTDLAIAAVESNSIWVCLGAGDGTYSTITEIPVGFDPHGVTVLDVDGDGDPDIVNSNNTDNNLSLHINNGAGVFAPPVYFDSGIASEYGLMAADMNNDGITDVVVGGRDSSRIITLRGNGNGTFTQMTSQSSGGNTWVVALGDLNGDGNLDATVANSISNNGAVLMGNGTGNFAAPVLMPTGNHTVASDLGDLDGDGDLDWMLSSFGGGFWRIYRNNGAGVFTFQQQIDAISNPSCAILLDFDNDLDLDLALSDEVADVVMLMRNLGSPAAVDDGSASLVRLSHAPDPVRDSATLRFELPSAGAASLRVFDATGRARRFEPLANLPAGANELRLETRDDAGRPLPAGIYYVELNAGGMRRIDRLVVVR